MKLHSSELEERAAVLHAGDRILLSGPVYTARDAAHKRIIALLNENKAPPFELSGACIYYAGATPTPPGAVIGSCGPTTSGRMDPFTPRLLGLGLRAMIGKGERSAEVCRAIQEHGAAYFCAIGGAGALAARCIAACEEIAFSDLGCESIKRLELREFPLIVAVDSCGGNLFQGNVKNGA
ncbi:MAG: FumA C-terminus/TtdB family hydratase beta subunit [Oscillospiraceae bacterium]|jgi:fumarate hydratase subunit beta|nr:FumA C-terminus/TtdB family hydratase beta subunit [Oscillospiraceae bacterium]